VVTLEEVTGLVRRELRRKMPKNIELNESTRLEDLGLSSLQVSEIVFTLEENHEVEFDSSRAADVQTLADVIAVANEAIAAKSPEATPAVNAGGMLNSAS
jgi:acyl carrier protein